MIDDGNRFLRSLVRLALVCVGGRVSNFDPIGARERLARARDFPRKSDYDIGEREQHGQQPAEGGCKGAIPVANPAFHQGYR
jgi:hypothetical protein